LEHENIPAAFIILQFCLIHAVFSINKLFGCDVKPFSWLFAQWWFYQEPKTFSSAWSRCIFLCCSQ